MPPSLPAALRLALRALWREPWLVAVGALVAGARRAALWPAFAVGWTIVARAALEALAARPLDPAAPFDAAAAALLAPRTLALVAGLWLAGALLGGALRVAWLAGAVPTLGGAMAGLGRAPRFAGGVASGFPAVLATALLALAAELAAGLYALTLVLAALRVAPRVANGGGVPLAAIVALVATLAIALPVAVGAVSDAAVARAALLREGPARAFAAAVRRFLLRPGTFVLAALALGLAGAVAPAAVEAGGGLATGFAASAPALLLLGPNLMVAATALVVAAAIELVWLATVSALACGGER